MVDAGAVERFIKYVDVRGPGECWPWKSADIGGYGVLQVNKRNIKATHISLWLWSDLLQPTPAHEACHSCDNPICCNPSHLWWGTRLENARDAKNKGRLNFGPDVRAKMSAVRKGVPKSEDHKRKIGAAQAGPLNHMYGKKLSPERVAALVKSRQAANQRKSNQE